MKNKGSLFLLALFLLFSLFSCKKDEETAPVLSGNLNLPEVAFDYESLNLPSHFTAEENLGKNIFFQPVFNGGAGCFGCHTTEAFVSANPGPQNNGLDATSNVDLGAGAVFPNPIFVGRFKTTSLRNIELTGPYMYDGRFATLEEVVEHYNSGVQAHPTLSPALRDPAGNPIRLNLSAAEKAALVAFLKTLTDVSISAEAKWSDPFASN